MASEVIKRVDFTVGRFKIPTNSYDSTVDNLQEYLDRYERKYLIKLLGEELYNAFMADLDVNGVPQNSPYTEIYEPLVIEDGCRCESEGMKEMLKGLVYWHFVRDTPTILTTDGAVQKAAENSIKLEVSSHDITSRYNQGVDSYRCIQRYIMRNRELYPSYKGWQLNYVLFI